MMINVKTLVALERERERERRSLTKVNRIKLVGLFFEIKSFLDGKNTKIN